MSTREDVLAALRRAGTTGLSGEALAHALGISRVAVGKHVSALRTAGYQIDAEPGVGYRLRAVPDGPLPAEIAPLLREASWMELTGGGPTGSTNDDARALAVAGAREGTVALASHQTAGRGRLGRAWDSPEGGAYFSVVLRPPLAPADLAPLALVIGLGVAKGLSAHLGVETAVKWPNDVRLNDGKLAGVLLEMTAESDRVEWVVAGVGLNVRRPMGGIPTRDAAWLDDALPGIGIAVAVAAALDGIAEAYAEWLSSGFGPMRAAYEARSSLIGQAVAVRTVAGDVRTAGTVMGIDDEGRLLVVTLGGIEAVAAGEVTLREDAGLAG